MKKTRLFKMYNQEGSNIDYYQNILRLMDRCNLYEDKVNVLLRSNINLKKLKELIKKLTLDKDIHCNENTYYLIEDLNTYANGSFNLLPDNSTLMYNHYKQDAGVFYILPTLSLVE